MFAVQIAIGGVRENQSGSGDRRVDSVRVAVFIGETKTESQAQAERCISGDREDWSVYENTCPPHPTALQITCYL